MPRVAGAATPRGAGASHAWVDVYTPTHGWRDFDPTNNLLAHDYYVKVALGRDYCDAAPTRGTYRGRAEETSRLPSARPSTSDANPARSARCSG